ncbi:MAG: Crp/Fnr family transcriptional regulator [Nitrospirae bacterium]|nr:Crp/Fnr family transcriptional regulator [Nitrospirota bacterium]
MTQERSKLWYLKNLDIFRYLGDEEYKLLDRYSNMREIKKGEMIYFQGSSDSNFYILKKGAVKITKLTPRGNEIILDILSVGTIFGEMTVLEPRERDESAIVIEDGLICIMNRDEFNRFSKMVPGLSGKMTSMIELKRWNRENKILDLLYCTVEQRLAKAFINLLDDFGIPHDNGHLLQIRLTHKDYADLIASTRETVTATLNKFKADGLIDFENKYIMIKSLDKIRGMAE